MRNGAYALIQGTRPANLAAGLSGPPPDSRPGWSTSSGSEAIAAAKSETRFSKDDLLTNTMIYWTTGTIGSSFLPYRDFAKAGAVRWTKETARDWIGSDATPTGFAVFPVDIAQPPRERAERFYAVERWTEMPRGGHFAAFEEPELLAEELRAFFRDKR